MVRWLVICSYVCADVIAILALVFYLVEGSRFRSDVSDYWTPWLVVATSAVIPLVWAVTAICRRGGWPEMTRRPRSFVILSQFILLPAWLAAFYFSLFAGSLVLQDSLKPVALPEQKITENLPNGGRLVITTRAYRDRKLRGDVWGTNSYEYIPPDSNVAESVGESSFVSGNSGLVTTEWIGGRNVFIAVGNKLFVRTEDATWHHLYLTLRELPGRDTELGKRLRSLYPKTEGYFEVVNVGGSDAWSRDYLRGSSILLNDEQIPRDIEAPAFSIFVSYLDSILKYKLDLSELQLELVEIRQKDK